MLAAAYACGSMFGMGFCQEDVLLITPNGYELINPPLPYTAADIRSANGAPEAMKKIGLFQGRARKAKFSGWRKRFGLSTIFRAFAAAHAIVFAAPIDPG